MVNLSIHGNILCQIFNRFSSLLTWSFSDVTRKILVLFDKNQLAGRFLIVIILLKVHILSLKLLVASLPLRCTLNSTF